MSAVEAPTVTRLGDGPVIGPDSHPSIGTNIQGPSVIEVPGWVADPLGRFHLYFADHKGTYIRLAFADHPAGPWTVYPAGSLQLADSRFPTEPPAVTDAEVEELIRRYTAAMGADRLPPDVRSDAITPHIASPDVHVDHEQRRIVMYFHGLESLAHQVSRVAVSDDGVHFTALPATIPDTYLRAFRHDGRWYGLAMPGVLHRSADGLTGWEAGPRDLFGVDMRHCAVRVVDGVLEVFWTRVGDDPERILLSTVALDGDWSNWTDGPAVEVLRPELPWEGVGRPTGSSVRGAVHEPVCQLRDPALFEHDGATYLFYAVAGESGIAVARLD